MQPGYWDTRGEHHTATTEAVVAVLSSMGIQITGPDDLRDLRDWVECETRRIIPPAVVATSGNPIRFRLLAPCNGALQVVVVGEDGRTLATAVRPMGGLSGDEIVIDGDFEIGYYRLVADLGNTCIESLVLIAPDTVPGAGVGVREWGVFAPLYGLWSNEGPGPSVGGLARLADRAHELGGSVVGTLPILATYLGRPHDPSPYTPVSRMYWNELFVDLAGIPPESWGSGSFDYEARAKIVDAVISDAAEAFFSYQTNSCSVGSRSEFDSFVARRPEVVDYARFRAVAEQYGAGWHSWSARERNGRLRPGDYDPCRVAHHMFAQWCMDTQMRSLDARMKRRTQRLYLDLPVGSHGDGYDTWRFAEQFVSGVAAGAPPDDFFEGGQNWGFPPLSPTACRDDAYGYLRQCLDHHMSVSGLLRLDHVMQMERLWWVPDGFAATDGVYVQYPREELFAVVAIESHRHGCFVVGENLGTVSDDVRELMARKAVPGMYVAQFEMPTWAGAELAEPESGCVASVDTHDTPTFSGFMAGLGSGVDPRERAQQIENLRGFLHARGYMAHDANDHELLRALHCFMGDSDAWLVLVTLEDLWGEMNSQNVPGTPFSRPNWVQKLAKSLDDLEYITAISSDLAALDQARRDSMNRANCSGEGAPT